MSGPSEAIDAAVLAAAIGVYRAIEAYVRRVVARDDGSGLFNVKIGFQRLEASERAPSVVRLLARERLVTPALVGYGAPSVTARRVDFARHARRRRRGDPRGRARARRRCEVLWLLQTIHGRATPWNRVKPRRSWPPRRSELSARPAAFRRVCGDKTSRRKTAGPPVLRRARQRSTERFTRRALNSTQLDPTPVTTRDDKREHSVNREQIRNLPDSVEQLCQTANDRPCRRPAAGPPWPSRFAFAFGRRHCVARKKLRGTMRL